MKPICALCQRFFSPKHNGMAFMENIPKASDKHAPPGTQAPDQWKPYKLWLGDLWECKGCGANIIVGTGHNPVAEHYQEDFANRTKDFNPQFQVNDC